MITLSSISYKTVFAHLILILKKKWFPCFKRHLIIMKVWKWMSLCKPVKEGSNAQDKFPSSLMPQPDLSRKQFWWCFSETDPHQPAISKTSGNIVLFSNSAIQERRQRQPLFSRPLQSSHSGVFAFAHSIFEDLRKQHTFSHAPHEPSFSPRTVQRLLRRNQSKNPTISE